MDQQQRHQNHTTPTGCPVPVLSNLCFLPSVHWFPVAAFPPNKEETFSVCICLLLGPELFITIAADFLPSRWQTGVTGDGEEHLQLEEVCHPRGVWSGEELFIRSCTSPPPPWLLEKAFPA